jgi:flavodoxin
MKALIIYDSTFGNTKIIAETISKELGKDAKSLLAADVNKDSLKDVSLLIVGSPILGWRPSEKTSRFLESLSKDQLKGMKASSFDTRMKVFYHGDAMKNISGKLKQAGAEIVAEPHAFYVKGKEGPLLDGEKEKAIEWAKIMKAKI